MEKKVLEEEFIFEMKKSKMIYYFIKRIIDVVTSLVLLIILLPIFIGTSIAIKLESKGPIIFKQRRVGKNSEIFYIYKFRSMKVNTPSLATSEFENAKDYTTRVGKLIRKTSIDELPQLINILKGEMSIVGPRPVIEKENDLIQLRKLYYVDTILPGITGWAQVNGRDDIDNKQKADYDYEYLKKQNIFFDMKILVMTVLKVLKSEGVK